MATLRNRHIWLVNSTTTSHPLLHPRSTKVIWKLWPNSISTNIHTLMRTMIMHLCWNLGFMPFGYTMLVKWRSSDWSCFLDLALSWSDCYGLLVLISIKLHKWTRSFIIVVLIFEDLVKMVRVVSLTFRWPIFLFFLIWAWHHFL